MTNGATGPYDPQGNRILAALPEAERRRLASHLEPAELNIGDVLYTPGKSIDTVWFPILGVCSILAELDGPAVEVATVGDEGMVGLPVFLGSAAPPNGRWSRSPDGGCGWTPTGSATRSPSWTGSSSSCCNAAPRRCSPSWHGTRPATAATAPGSAAPAGSS